MGVGVSYERGTPTPCFQLNLHDSGCRVQGQNSGCRVQGSGVSVSGFSVYPGGEGNEAPGRVAPREGRLEHLLSYYMYVCL